MAYRRSYPKKKRTYKRRRYVRKSRIPRKMSSNIYSFKRNVNLGAITTTGAATEFGSFNFKLSDLPNYAEFSNLYDMYKLTFVKIYFVPFTMDNSSSGGAVTDSTQWQNLYSCIDNNSSVIPTSADQIRQYQTCKFTRMGKIHKRIIYPKPATMIYDGATTAYGLAKSTWMNTSYPTIPHYGLKWCFENATLDVNSKFFKVEAVYYLKFKSVL